MAPLKYCKLTSTLGLSITIRDANIIAAEVGTEAAVALFATATCVTLLVF